MRFLPEYVVLIEEHKDDRRFLYVHDDAWDSLFEMPPPLGGVAPVSGEVLDRIEKYLTTDIINKLPI